ncbi:leucine-rich repeat-containing protein 16 [Paragonimus westermani]|uniref:Leucine-rich repeat-containing protein 16 n=1 Tax=Paragonimus westermani TaxID=34504 RepID=A0A5J4P1L2_9TREM|nr:leucine-rich repeat-containing protein 16 [Paragonimus westermani]
MLLCVASTKCTRSIELSGIDLTSECIEVLGTTLDEVPSINNLEISRCHFPRLLFLCTEQLAQLLVCGKNLTSLVLRDNRVVNDRVMKLLHSLTPKFGTQLQTLRLSGCKLSVAGLEALAFTLTGLNDRTGDSVSYTALTELDLSHNNLVGEKPQALMHLFACSPHLSVIRLAYCGSSLEWLPSALSRGCRSVLKVLDISGNEFDHFPTNEWHALFATTINLEQLNFCHCQGPYLGETIKTIFCGLSRLQGRATNKRLSVGLANNQLGRPGTKPLSYHISLLADLLTELDLSECELGDHALDVFNSLESCVKLETLTLNGPWAGVSANVQRSIMISLSNLLKAPNCRLRRLSLSNVDLGENVLYLLADLLNYPSLEHLDLSGNQMGDGVAHILARLISARSNRLRFLHFDRNQLSLTAIEELVQAAAINGSYVKLRVPLYDLMTHLNHNEPMCYQLTSQIESLYTPKSQVSSKQWWTNWAESENIQTTIHCVTRLCHDTRQLYTEVQKRSQSLGRPLGPAVSVENGTDHEDNNNHNNVRRWLNDADHVKDLLNKFIATAQDYIEDFVKRSSDLIMSRMQSGIESHLEHLGLSMRETAQRICSTQGDAGSISVRELIRNAQNRVSKGLKEVVQSKFLPELEKQVQPSSKLSSLKNFSRDTQETSASRRYPIDEFLSKRQLKDNDDLQNDNQMLLRGLGIKMKNPKSSPIHAILTASSATHVVNDKHSSSESKYLSLPTLGVQMISVSGKQKSNSLHHSTLTKSDVVLTKVYTPNETDDVDSEVTVFMHYMSIYDQL